MNMFEIGHAISQKRKTLGLSQERLAKLTGLSRLTIYQLELSTLEDIGIKKLMEILDLLGINLKLSPARGRRNAIQMAAQSASVSYRSSLKEEELVSFLKTGSAQDQWLPYFATLVDEVPMSLLCSCVEQVAAQEKINPKMVWKNIFRFSTEIKSPRSDLFR